MDAYQGDMTDSMKMAKNKNHITKIILNLTLEIIYMLTGEEYTVVKKTSSECLIHSSCPCLSEEWNKTQSPMVESSSDSVIHDKNNDQRILALTNKIVYLLTGEVPIRCQDVTVYFSMEEWEYLEGHQDVYKDIMMETHQLLTCPDGYNKSDLQETCRAEDHSVPQEASRVLCGVSYMDRSTLQINLAGQRDPTEAIKASEASSTPISSPDDFSNDHNSIRNFQTPKCTSLDKLKINNCLEKVSEKPVLYGPENLCNPFMHISADHIPHFQSLHVKEEPVTSNEENFTDSSDHTQDLSICIKEEPWNEGDYTDMYTPTAHVQQYSSAHIELFVSYEEKPFMNNGTVLVNSPTEYVASSASTDINNEQQLIKDVHLFARKLPLKRLHHQGGNKDGLNTKEEREALQILEDLAEENEQEQKAARTIDFLDLKIEANERGCLATDIHRKDTAVNTVLHASSAHPRATIGGIPTGQFLLLKRICSDKGLTSKI
ncbi:uncharacterized protein LOC122941349 isoform X2 [Bufo gargarizans]|uniref:uncharacterized protein LOC122941349 isoform X2 n=1 Tax=Bufo gargarizans TaxID=30331 RepID=UPI001CF0E07C|nr:uncharacterized protein LOC122941349 isoform X2 [Bufo gargarizans]